jgi:hypothetical protein
VTKSHYQIGQHDVADMEYTLVDHGMDGGICSIDMLVLEGSEHFIDLIGLAWYKVSQLQIAMA